jgi:hypothetical protein
MRPSLACGKQEDAHVSKLIAEMEERNAAEGEYSEQDVKGFKGAVPKERRMARHCTDPDGRPHCVGPRRAARLPRPQPSPSMPTDRPRPQRAEGRRPALQVDPVFVKFSAVTARSPQQTIRCALR